MFHPNIDGSSVRRQYGIEQRDIVLFIGSGLLWHGLGEIVEAAPFVVRAIPSAVFLIVGGSPEIKDWEDVVTRRGLQEWFRFAGAVEYEKVPGYIAAADVALAPYNSRLAEHDRHKFASPLKVLEYMAGGKALVVTSVANVRQTVEDGLTGLVVPEDSPDALARAILRLLRSPGLRRNLGANARAAAETRFSWAKHCSFLRELFLAAGKSAHPKSQELLSEAKA
jgi:glycosyltransferase involved in cell wall biosynthesis